MASHKPICKSSDYRRGSFAERVHKFLEGKKADEDNNFTYLVSNPAELVIFFKGMLDEFILHTKPVFANVKPDKDFDFVDKWNRVGAFLLNTDAQKAETWYLGLYDVLKEGEKLPTFRHGKGTPLHNAGVANLILKNPHQATKLFHLAYIEDLITDVLNKTADRKKLPACRELGNLGVPDTELNKIDKLGERLIKQDKDIYLFPESIYLEFTLSDGSIRRTTEVESVDPRIVRSILNKCGNSSLTSDQKGKLLEFLAAYIFDSVECFEVLKDVKTNDAQHDLLVRNLSSKDPVITEFGKYILVECKNWEDRVDAKTIKAFIGNLRFHNCKCGILLARNGITGKKNDQELTYATRTILKEYHQDGIIVIVLDEKSLKEIANQRSVLTVLLREYEKVRFDQI